MKQFFLFLLLIFAVGRLYAQDTIRKNDSTAIAARIYEITDAEIKYRKFSNPDGPIYSVKKSDVSYIVYQNGEKETFTIPAPVTVAVPYDTLAYIEKMLGVTLKAVTEPDTGCLITDVVNTGRVRAPGLKPPKGDILQYVGTSDKKSELRATGRKIYTTDDAVRAIVNLRNQGLTKIYFLTRFNANVDHIYIADITDLVFSQEKIAENAKKDSVAQSVRLPSPYKKRHWVITAGASLRNSYSTIELSQWLYTLNGVPATYDDGLNDGPEAFYFGSLTYNFPLSRKKARPACMGASLSINYWRDLYGFWSIQGRIVTYASSSPVNYIRLRPLKLGLAIPFRVPITDYSAFVVTPALLYAKVHGISYGSTDPDMRYYDKSSGFGVSVDAGLELFFGKKKMVGATALIGIRQLKTALYSSPDQVTYTQVTFSDGRPVYVGLNGLYAGLGVSFRFARQ